MEREEEKERERERRREKKAEEERRREKKREEKREEDHSLGSGMIQPFRVLGCTCKASTFGFVDLLIGKFTPLWR